MKKNILPKIFKPLLWSQKIADYKESLDKKTLVVNSINYGDLEHWSWLARRFGKKTLGKFISNIPKSEFRQGALKLVGLVFHIKKMKYASYYDLRKRKKNPAKV